MKLRKYDDWFNERAMRRHYGIQAQVAKGQKFMHLAANGAPLIFPTEAERDKRLAEIRAAVKRGARLVQLNSKFAVVGD